MFYRHSYRSRIPNPTPPPPTVLPDMSKAGAMQADADRVFAALQATAPDEIAATLATLQAQLDAGQGSPDRRAAVRLGIQHFMATQEQK